MILEWFWTFAKVIILLIVVILIIWECSKDE